MATLFGEHNSTEYKLIQDVFTGGLTEKIRLQTYKLDTNGDYIYDIAGDKVVIDNLLFACCTRKEFVSIITAGLKNSKKFPFIFIESGDNITYAPEINGETEVDIKEVFLCTLTNVDLLASARDFISFKTILFPLKYAFEKTIKEEGFTYRLPTKNQSIGFHQYHSYVTGGSNFEEKLDVIILNNLKIKLKTKC